MRIFVAGATGTLGRPVVQALVKNGHEVVGLTRTQDGARRLRNMGAEPVVGNALDREGLKALVLEARPEVVVHLLTALPPAGVMRKGQLRPTNELRTTGTANLIAAAVAAKARRIVAESFVGIYAEGRRDGLLREDEPLPPVPDGHVKDTILALRSLEDQLAAATASSGIETVALRFGFFYGSDVPSTRLMIDQMKAGKMFLPAGLSGVASFVHVDDAAAAVVAAVERAHVSGVFNIADDRPIAMSDFILRLGEAAAAPRPRTIPNWVVRLAAPVIAAMASANVRLDNSNAKRDLGWTLRYPTLDEGLSDLRGFVAAA